MAAVLLSPSRHQMDFYFRLCALQDYWKKYWLAVLAETVQQPDQDWRVELVAGWDHLVVAAAA